MPLKNPKLIRVKKLLHTFSFTGPPDRGLAPLSNLLPARLVGIVLVVVEVVDELNNVVGLQAAALAVVLLGFLAEDVLTF